MICYSLQVASSELALGQVTKCEDSYFVTEKGVFCTVYDFKTIAKLQQEFGTGIVNYCPFPTIACQKDGEKKDKVIIVSQNAKTDTTVAKSMAKTLGIESEVCVASSINARSILENISGSSFIIVNGNVRTSIIHMVFSSGCPFVLVSCSDVKARKMLELCGMSKLIYNNKHSPSTFINDVWLNREIIIETLKETTERFKAFISWAPNCKPFVDTTYQDITDRRNSDTGFKFTLSPNEHKDPYLKNISEKLFTHSTTGGIHLRLSVVKDFTESGLVLLHPWIGIIETTEVEVITQFQELSNFKASIAMCLGLFTHSREVCDLLATKTRCTIIDQILIKDDENLFEYEEWKKNLVVINISNPREAVSLNNTEDFETKHFICCLKQVSHKISQRILAMASRCIPIILPRCEISEGILGANYPLFVDDVKLIDPFNLNRWLTEDTIRETHQYLLKLTKTVSEMVEILSDSDIGTSVRDLYINPSNHHVK